MHTKHNKKIVNFKMMVMFLKGIFYKMKDVCLKKSENAFKSLELDIL